MYLDNNFRKKTITYISWPTLKQTRCIHKAKGRKITIRIINMFIKN